MNGIVKACISAPVAGETVVGTSLASIAVTNQLAAEQLSAKSASLKPWCVIDLECLDRFRSLSGASWSGAQARPMATHAADAHLAGDALADARIAAAAAVRAPQRFPVPSRTIRSR